MTWNALPRPRPGGSTHSGLADCGSICIPASPWTPYRKTRYAGRMPNSPNLHLGQDGKLFPDAFYARIGEHRFASTLHSQGACSRPGEQHLAVASGLMLAEVERRLPSDKLVSRASFDILGVIHSGEFTVDVNVVRAGRTIELIEASMRHGEQISIRARVWRLAASDTQKVQGLEWPTLPPPDSLPALRISSIALEWWFHQRCSRRRREAVARPGRGAQLAAYALSPHLGRGRPPPSRAFWKLVDTANGLVVPQAPRSGEVFFANVDLTVASSFRLPEAGWVGFDTRVNFEDPAGSGKPFLC